MPLFLFAIKQTLFALSEVSQSVAYEVNDDSGLHRSSSYWFLVSHKTFSVKRKRSKLFNIL